MAGWLAVVGGTTYALFALWVRADGRLANWTWNQLRDYFDDREAFIKDSNTTYLVIAIGTGGIAILGLVAVVFRLR